MGKKKGKTEIVTFCQKQEKKGNMKNILIVNQNRIV